MEEKKERFTPGPWESKGRTICPKNQLDPLNTEIVCRIHENRFASREEANAALIAAAPEMYEMLVKIYEHKIDFRRCAYCHGSYEKCPIKELLKKARGEK